jgi:hypothetical protein
MDEICRSCGETLRPGEEFCPRCEAPAAYRPSRQRGLRRGAAAVAIGGVLAVGLGVLFGILVTRPAAEPTAAGSPTPSPSPSASADADATTEPSSSPIPTSTSTPGPTASPTVDALTNRTVADVAVTGLNLRREPGGGAEARGTLDAGARVFVIGAPQVVDDLAWYRVAVVDGPYSGCVEEYCPNDIGWVAEGGTDVDPWLRPVELECPSSPMTAEQLEVLRPLERLSCYGGNEIVVTGTLHVCYCDANQPLTWEPFWLAMPIAPFLFHETGMFVRFEEDAPPELEPGDVVRATLAMEHEAALTCVARASPGFFGPMPSGESAPTIEEPDAAETVLGCRTQLVMKNYEVIGFEDVSLPGG